eukprot:g10819.t1
MEHCAQAREASTRVLSLRFAERDVIRSSLQRESMAVKDAHVEARLQSNERWAGKLQKSPYLADLAAASERIEEEQRIRDKVAERKKNVLAKRQQEAETAKKALEHAGLHEEMFLNFFSVQVIQRMLNDKDELEALRAEKRYLMHREKELQSVRDLEKTRAKCARVDAERRHALLDREHALLQQRLKEDPGGHGGARALPAP